MRKVISNTTPLLSLLKIDQLLLLEKLYGKILIPHGVYEEIESGKEKPYYRDLADVDWIDIEKIQDKKARFYLLDLDKGEAEVLILAKEYNADLVIIDELSGRRYAKQMNLTLTGTLGILLRAKSEGVIPSVKTLITVLEQKGSWFNPHLVADVIALAGEN